MSSQVFSTYRTCTWRCRSQQHAVHLASAITKSSSSISAEQLKLYIALTCAGIGHLRDEGGRTLIHWAASVGDREELLEWLLDEIGAEINPKDFESGYTPLHRALLHGQLASAQVLIDRGAYLGIFDNEEMTPLDIVRRDQNEQFRLEGPTEVYSCGENVTSNLGHRVPTERLTPDLVYYFSHNSLSVKQVAMSKWHTVFLTFDGHVYTCGRGSLGRLGHGDLNDRTVPTRVQISDDLFQSISVGDDHTIAVTRRGSAWGWGSNGRCQLGAPAGTAFFSMPQLISLGKNVKDEKWLGCVCGNEYTLLWTVSGNVYGCGANDGQFGHCALRNEPDLCPLRQITGLRFTSLEDAACAGPAVGFLTIIKKSSATGVTTEKRDVLLRHNYESRRLFGSEADFTRIMINSSGGMKTEQGKQQQHSVNTNVRLTAISRIGEVYYWDTMDRCLRRCLFGGSIRRMIYPRVGCAFGANGLYLITPNGQLYKGQIMDFRHPADSGDVSNERLNTSTTGDKSGMERRSSRKTSSVGSSKQSIASSFTQCSPVKLLDPSECQVIVLSSPIPSVHRAIAVASSSDGRNFCVIQQSPNSNLTELPPEIDSTLRGDYRMMLDEANVDDCLHDVQIQTSQNHAQFRAVHKFILCSRCPYFAERLRPSTSQFQIDEPAYALNESTLDRILNFIYTDDCDLLHAGPITGHMTQEASVAKSVKARDPVRELTEAAKRLNLKSLLKRLESIRWDSGTNSIQAQRRSFQAPHALQFEPKSFPELCDVVLHCKDGMKIPAHRCILSARSEYFRCMFATGYWAETHRHQTLKVDVESTVLEPVIQYLYKDLLPTMPTSERRKDPTGSTVDECAAADKDALEYYGRILVCADQWLLDRLRRLCEMELAARITLRNVADMLEFAHAINAVKLFDSCAQFISLNLCSLLDGNAFRNSSLDCLRLVGAYYRNMYPHVGHRTLTPSLDPPSLDDIQNVWNEITSSGLSPDDLLEEFSTWLSQIQTLGDSPTAIGASGRRKRAGTKLTPRTRKTSNSETNSYAGNAHEKGADTTGKNVDTGRGSDDDNRISSLANSRYTNVIPIHEETNENHQSTAVVAKMRIQGSQPIAVPISKTTTRRPRNKPWNITVSPENIPQVSLRDLMAAEEKKEVAASTEERKRSDHIHPLVSPKSTIAWTSTSPPSFLVKAHVQHAPAQIESVVVSTREKRPFKDIMNEERSKETARTKTVNKPLKFVQEEELAMQELTLLYQIDDQWDEFITVERAPSIVAEPTWQAHLGSPPKF